MEDRCSPFFWATYPNNPFFCFLDDCFTSFLFRYGGIFEYYHINYTVGVGYRYVPAIRAQLDWLITIQPSTAPFSELMKMINNPFDKNMFEEYLHSTFVQKLSNKKSIPQDYTELGEKTYWYYLTRLKKLK